MIRRRFLSPLGRHIHDALLRPVSEWRISGSALVHVSGLSLSMIPGAFDLNDKSGSDYITELGFLDRLILRPMAARVRSELKVREVLGG